MAFAQRHIENIRSKGFRGFLPVSTLRLEENLDTVPREAGVYLILNPTQEKPEFLNKSVGGHYRGDPTVDLECLEKNWVDGAKILYVGHTPRRILYERVSELIEFGSGEPIGHWGGRLIWQLKNHNELLICWLTHKDPVETRKKIIREFKFKYKALPFANLRSPT